MGKRQQQRTRGVLPVKINVPDSGSFLSHTLDISASGARAVLPAMLQPGAVLTIEFKHKRATAVIAWCKPVKKSGTSFEVGLRLEKASSDFWGVALPTDDLDAFLSDGTHGHILRFSRSDYFDKPY